MVKQTIQIFARVKPTKAQAGLYEVDNENENGSILALNIPRELSSGYVNNKKEDFKFKFEKVFDRNAKQDDIFDNVAKPVIDNVLEGYNGTIFAYGQTGSGKTFTITGGPERYQDRGIIPRSLSYIFQHIKNNPEWVFDVGVSYLEIYNENGYDLLDPKHEASKLEDLPKVRLREDPEQNIHLANLTKLTANNEEEALNFLFLGDTNRMIAETPMNQASTRSHCIFTIHIIAREAGSANKLNCKLHLVDLAGSERVSKTGVNGVLLQEAKYINLSLHFLEQVIVCLSDKNRGHIPYRNSMMTSVLRDSLGGNCMTTMIATCSIEKKNLEESISTCRFAQRVALIKNDAIRNEELDPKLMIERLKREIAGLKDELAMAAGGDQRSDELSEEDLQRCKEAVQQYLDDTDPEATINVGADMRKIQQCYRLLKQAVLSRGPERNSVPSSPSTLRENPEEPETYLHSTETKKLRELVLQRDTEINILVNMLKKEKKRAIGVTSQLESLGHAAPPRPISTDQEQQSRVFAAQQNGNGFAGHRSQSVGSGLGSKQQWSSPEEQKPPTRDETEEKAKKKILGNMSMGRQEAFEIFRRDYAHNTNIEENKQTYRTRIAEAKELGEKINNVRKKMKTTAFHLQLSQGQQGDGNTEPNEEELALRDQLKQEKAVYNDASQRLRAMKPEIEHLQHLLEKAKLQMMKDFENWWIEQTAKFQNESPRKPNPSHTKAAWKTPPVTPQYPLSVASSTTSLQTTDTTRSDLSQLNPLKQNGAGGRTTSSGYRSSSLSMTPSPPQHRPPSGRTRQQPPMEKVGGIQLTGDAEADADIMAFVKARQNVSKAAHGALR